MAGRFELPFTISLVAFIVVSVIFFMTKPKGLQAKEVPTDKDGKCPARCCNSCNVNLFYAFGAAGGVALAVFLIAYFAKGSHRAEAKQYVKGSGSSASGSASRSASS